MFITMTKDQDQTFTPLYQTVTSKLCNWLQAKIDNTGHLAFPTEVPFLAQPACTQEIGKGEAAKSIGFVFKHDTDPTNLHPLRGLQMTLDNGGTLTCGKTNETPQVFKITGEKSTSSLVCITKVTTYYIQYIGQDSSLLKKYGQRIVVIIVEFKYNDGRETNKNAACAFYIPTEKFKITNYTPGSIITEEEISNLYKNFNDLVAEYNKNDKYNIFTSTIKDIENTFKWDDKYLNSELYYIKYSQFTTNSKTYINNFSFVFKSSTLNILPTIVKSAKKISVFAPFYKFAYGKTCKLTLSADQTRTRRSLEVTEKSTSHTIRIPEISVDSIGSLSSAYEFTYSQKNSAEKENTAESKLSNSVELSVGKGYYVAAGFPSQRRYETSMIIRLFDDTSENAEPKYTMQIPLAVNTPCIAASNDEDLTKALLDCI